MCNKCVYAETTGTQMSLIQDKNHSAFCYLQARLVQDMQKLNTDHFDWATSIVLARYPGAVQVHIFHNFLHSSWEK